MEPNSVEEERRKEGKKIGGEKELIEDWREKELIKRGECGEKGIQMGKMVRKGSR